MNDIITISDHRIRRMDTSNWMLEHYIEVEHRDGTKDMVWRGVGCYGKLEHMLDAILSRKLKGPRKEVRDLKASIVTLQEELREVREELLGAVK